MLPKSELHILHFNDTYEIESSTDDPCGGAARFCSVVDAARALCEFRGGHSLLLHSGDAFSPSILSSATNGRHMVDVLHTLRVGCACVGNHELDLGVERATRLMQECGFPWVLSNLRMRATGLPLCDALESVIVEVGPWRVGLMGLVESNWVDTLATVKPRDVEWEEPLGVALRVAQGLRESGAHLVIALTHMRLINDTTLRRALIDRERQTGERLVDVIMGGHDHDVSHTVEGSHGAGMPLIKSGCEFRWLSRVIVTGGETSNLPPGSPLPTLPQCPVSFVGATPAGKFSRLGMLVDLFTVVSALPEDAQMTALVNSKLKSLDGELSRVVGLSCVALDVREEYVRRRETAVGNMMADLMRRSVDADIALLNSGTLRGNCVLRPGLLKMKDMVTLLPFFGDTVVKVRVRGEALVRALENAVSMWPATDGRFCQVSGVRFSFDPNKAPGSRVIVNSVRILARRRKWGDRVSQSCSGTGGGGGARSPRGKSVVVGERNSSPMVGGGEKNIWDSKLEEFGGGDGRRVCASDAESSGGGEGVGLTVVAMPPLPLSPIAVAASRGGSNGSGGGGGSDSGGGGYTFGTQNEVYLARTPISMNDRHGMYSGISEESENTPLVPSLFSVKSSIDSVTSAEYEDGFFPQGAPLGSNDLHGTAVGANTTADDDDEDADGAILRDPLSLRVEEDIHHHHHHHGHLGGVHGGEQLSSLLDPPFLRPPSPSHSIVSSGNVNDTRAATTSVCFQVKDFEKLDVNDLVGEEKTDVPVVQFQQQQQQQQQERSSMLSSKEEELSDDETTLDNGPPPPLKIRVNIQQQKPPSSFPNSPPSSFSPTSSSLHPFSKSVADKEARMQNEMEGRSVWLPVDFSALYTMAIKHYLLMGKDGYSMFNEDSFHGNGADGESDFTVLVPQASGHSLPALLRSHLEVLENWGSSERVTSSMNEGNLSRVHASSSSSSSSCSLSNMVDGGGPPDSRVGEITSPRYRGASSLAGGMAESRIAPRVGGIVRVPSLLVALSNSEDNSNTVGSGISSPLSSACPPPFSDSNFEKRTQLGEDQRSGAGMALLTSLPEYAGTLSAVPFHSQNPLDIIARASAVTDSGGSGKRKQGSGRDSKAEEEEEEEDRSSVPTSPIPVNVLDVQQQQQQQQRRMQAPVTAAATTPLPYSLAIAPRVEGRIKVSPLLIQLSPGINVKLWAPSGTLPSFAPAGTFWLPSSSLWGISLPGEDTVSAVLRLREATTSERDQLPPAAEGGIEVEWFSRANPDAAVDSVYFGGGKEAEEKEAEEQVGVGGKLEEGDSGRANEAGGAGALSRSSRRPQVAQHNSPSSSSSFFSYNRPPWGRVWAVPPPPSNDSSLVPIWEFWLGSLSVPGVDTSGNLVSYPSKAFLNSSSSAAAAAAAPGVVVPPLLPTTTTTTRTRETVVVGKLSPVLSAPQFSWGGIAWSADGRLMYLVDSARGGVWVWEMDLCPPGCASDLYPLGKIRGRLGVGPVLLFNTPYPSPTGCALDTLGRLWIAHSPAGRVCCYESAPGYVGGIAVEVRLPLGSSPFDCVWGGKRGEELMVTTEERGCFIIPKETLRLEVTGEVKACTAPSLPSLL